MPGYDYQSDGRVFSRVLEDIGAKQDPKLYLGELIDAFGERGFGALMLFLGLISALIGAVPGTTTILGLPLMLISMQLVIRRDQLWFPRWAMKRHLDRAAYRAVVGKAVKPLRSIEKVARPRLFVMSNEVSEVLIGLICTLLAFILILPIWGGNLVPSLIIAAFGFGLMQRDGLVIAGAWTVTAIIATALWLAWEMVSRFLEPTWVWLTGLFS